MLRWAWWRRTLPNWSGGGQRWRGGDVTGSGAHEWRSAGRLEVEADTRERVSTAWQGSGGEASLQLRYSCARIWSTCPGQCMIRLARGKVTNGTKFLAPGCRGSGARVMGNPLIASKGKGERLFNVLLERLIETCREYHEMEPPVARFGGHLSLSRQGIERRDLQPGGP